MRRQSVFVPLNSDGMGITLKMIIIGIYIDAHSMHVCRLRRRIAVATTAHRMLYGWQEANELIHVY